MPSGPHARVSYHEGERAVQERAGVRVMAERIGRGIGDALAPAMAAFLAQRYTAYLGSIDGGGRAWASQLSGPPGFLRVIDERRLHLDAAPEAGDRLRDNLLANPALGLLAIDLTTRRRVRVNGRASIDRAGGIDLAVEQALANCPKYIQRREPVEVLRESGSRELEISDVLGPRVRALAADADTFFLATAHPTAGADVSHRGGRPGFVEVVDERTLRWPDYPGNTMFLSLGNLAVDPRAGLLFVEWEGQGVAQLTGRARIDWDPVVSTRSPGAERVVELTVDEVRWLPAGNPIRWRLVEPSPHNP